MSAQSSILPDDSSSPGDQPLTVYTDPLQLPPRSDLWREYEKRKHDMMFVEKVPFAEWDQRIADLLEELGL